MRRRDTIHADYEVKNEALALRRDDPEAVSSAFTPRKQHTLTGSCSSSHLLMHRHFLEDYDPGVRMGQLDLIPPLGGN